MKNLARQFYEFFYYTRRERDATFVLLVLIVIFVFVPAIYSHYVPPEPKVDFSKYKEAIAAAMEKEETSAEEEWEEEEITFRGTPVERTIELFEFDPNTVLKDEMVRLGLSPRTAQTLINFRTKGGKFHKKEDLKKVYGLREEDYDRLEPFISIEQKEAAFIRNEKIDSQIRKESTLPVDRPFNDRYSPTVKEVEPILIDINQATVEEWQQLSGIGPAYSKRIVNFREKLGGFASVELVGRTFGLPDSTFQKIFPYLQPSPIYRKLNINTCSLEELKKHPLLSNYQATILFNYRKQHGGFANAEDLKKIKAGFDEAEWPILSAYFSFE